MHCPFCSTDDTKVIDSRLVAEGDQVRRRRGCLSCHERFTTYEVAELVMPRIIKQNGDREPFDEDKLRAGFERATRKRPVSAEDIEGVITQIKSALRATGEREIKSRVPGEYVMEQLKRLDQVAYDRFASVYRSFQDLSEFRAEIDDFPTTRSKNLEAVGGLGAIGPHFAVSEGHGHFIDDLEPAFAFEDDLGAIAEGELGDASFKGDFAFTELSRVQSRISSEFRIVVGREQGE